jgi:hypothetical protein
VGGGGFKPRFAAQFRALRLRRGTGTIVSQ